MAKQMVFESDARDAIRRGVEKLAKAVVSTLGPRGRNAILDKGWGAPTITKDGVTVAEEIQLQDPYEHMGAQLVKEVASKTSDVAGDGTTTATLLTEAIFTQGLRAVILRPGQIFGPGAPLLTGAVAQRSGERLVILGNGRQVLPLIYVDDVVDAMLLAAERNVWTGEIFHLVDDAAVTQEQLARRAEPGRKLVKLSRFLVGTLALGAQTLAAVLRRPAPISRYRIKSALAPLRFDCGAARQTLGWAPRVGVEEGLERTLASLPKP